MKTFEDLEFEQINDAPFMVGKKSRMHFDNGFGVSVVSHSYSYGGRDGLYEIAVLDSDDNLTYDGGTTATVAVSGASALTTNAVTKWSGNAFVDSSLTDNGTTISGTTSIQLSGASSAGVSGAASPVPPLIAFLINNLISEIGIKNPITLE